MKIVLYDLFDLLEVDEEASGIAGSKSWAPLDSILVIEQEEKKAYKQQRSRKNLARTRIHSDSSSPCCWLDEDGPNFD
jgi:hypothetical protein